jgi:hypothetical protein
MRVDDSRRRRSRPTAAGGGRLGDPTQQQRVPVGGRRVVVFASDVGRDRQPAKHGLEEAGKHLASNFDVADGGLGHTGHGRHHGRHCGLDFGVQAEGHGFIY